MNQIYENTDYDLDLQRIIQDSILLNRFTTNRNNHDNDSISDDSDDNDSDDNDDNDSDDNDDNDSDDNDSTECPICFEEINDKNMIYLKSCKHKFCHKCINYLIDKNLNNCPYCRVPFSKYDIINDLDKGRPLINFKPCKCGSTSHQRTNHRHCPFNKKN